MYKKFVSNEKGTAIIIVALAMAAILGCVGLAVDVGIIYLEDQRMQTAVDAACLAGLQELPDTSAATDKVIEYALLNGIPESEISINFTNNDRRIIVSSNKDQALFFLKILGFSNSSLNAVAASEAGSPGQAFDYTVFSGSTSDTLKINGNDLLINGSAHTNQNFQAGGNHIEVTGACEAVGTIKTNGNNINISYRYPDSGVIDMPNYENEIQAQAQASGQVFNSSVHYNGNSLDVSNSIYVNGDVHINGNTINGAGAILATGDIHINGNCIHATANDQICVYSQGDIKINGNNIAIDGILYAPNGSIELNGNSITINGRVVGHTVKFNGNDISIIGDSTSVISLPGGGYRLVQ